MAVTLWSKHVVNDFVVLGFIVAYRNGTRQPVGKHLIRGIKNKCQKQQIKRYPLIIIVMIDFARVALNGVSTVDQASGMN